MNLSRLINEIRKNGGASYSLLYGDMTGRQGFALSLHKDRERLVVSIDLDENEIRNYILDNSDLLSEKENFLGIWLEKGVYYLDVATFERSEQKAIKLAKIHTQQAIFNLETLETVNV